MSRLLLLVAVLALAGCGGRGEAGRVDATETLLLDSSPRAEHAGIYLAVARGYDRTEGVELRIRPPGGPGALELLRTGRVNAALMDPEDQPTARGRGDDIIGVMAVVQRPLLTLVVTRDTLTDHRPEIRALIRALQRGYVETLTDPESSVSAMVDQQEGLDRAAVAASLDAIGSAFTEGAPVYGALVPERLPGGRRAFDTTLVGPISRD
jgi:ABC-type nitrate/sulfonate/bicarbonate transport system substrate-binding protein